MTSTSGSSCKPYRIEKDRLCGRQLVATRKIIAGELIIDEPALITGPGFARGNNAINIRTPDCASSGLITDPSDFTQADDYVCLVCCRNVSLSNRLQCPVCNLMLCSETCQSHAQHSQNECLVFPKIRYIWEQKSRSKKSLYSLILIIRGLFYQFRDSTKLDQINVLESKSEALENLGVFEELRDVFESLSEELFSENQNAISGRDIVQSAKHCLGVLRINAFSSFSESHSREGLFFLSSFMSHSCVINTDRQMSNGSDSIRMVVRASVDIEKDEPITTTYLSLLYNTHERHHIMDTSWLFTCYCKRCLDPSECGSHSASTRPQPRPQQGKITENQNESSGNGIEYSLGNNWTTSFTFNAEHEQIQQIINSRPRNLYEIGKLEDWLDRYDNGKVVHPHHSLFAHVKLFLCQYYGRQIGGMSSISSSQLRRKILYCDQILDIYDRVAPGIQMCRGVILFELWCALRKLRDLQELSHSAISRDNHFRDGGEQSMIDSVSNMNLFPSFSREHDVVKIKKEVEEIFKYALPNSSERSMSNYLCEEESLY